MVVILNGSELNASRILLNDALFDKRNESHILSNTELQLLEKMLIETQDILESDDFKRVLDCGIDVGFSIIMDMILGCFVRIDNEKSSTSNDNGFTNPHSIRIPFVKL